MNKDSALKHIFRTLRYRNFRLFFTGQSISLIGTWIQTIAMSWLVYRMTDSPFLLGLVGFLSQIPAFIMSPLAGVVADRFDRRRILMITQTLFMIQAFLLAVLTLSGAITIVHIIILAVIFGCVTSFDIPARQSFIMEMVEKKEHLGNAISLNSLMFNSARLIGPSIAGVIIAKLGEGLCFFINGLTFITVIVSLAAMRIDPQKRTGEYSHPVEGLKEGFFYTFGFAPIRIILSILGVVSLVGMSYTVLMPVFAKDILGGGPSTLGFLMASGGVGALVANLYLASRKTVVGLGRLIPVSGVIFSIGLMLFSASRSLFLSMLLLVFVGFGFMTGAAACNIILQTITDDDKRGRVMSFYTMAFIGMAPIGSIAAGSLASKVGTPNTLIIFGVICIISSMVFMTKLPYLRKTIHPIYKRIGIMPEVYN